MKALVTKVNRFNFTNDDGEVIKGAKLHYLPINISKPETNTSGEETIPVSIPFEEFSVYHGNVPCIANLDLTFKQSGSGIKLRYQGGQIRTKLDFTKLPGVNA